MPVDLEGVRQKAEDGDPTQRVFVTRRWIKLLYDHMKADEATIARLAKENQALRAGATITQSATVNGKDVPFPEKEFEDVMRKHDEVFKASDGLFSSVSTMFSKITRRG